MYRTNEDRGMVFVPKDTYFREIQRSENEINYLSDLGDINEYSDAQTAARKILNRLEQTDGSDGTIRNAEKKAKQLLDQYLTTHNKDLTFSSVEELEFEKTILMKRLTAIDYALHIKTKHMNKPPPDRAAAIYWNKLRNVLRFTFILKYAIRRRRWGY